MLEESAKLRPLASSFLGTGVIWKMSGKGCALSSHKRPNEDENALKHRNGLDDCK